MFGSFANETYVAIGTNISSTIDLIQNNMYLLYTDYTQDVHSFQNYSTQIWYLVRYFQTEVRKHMHRVLRIYSYEK